MSAWIRLGWGVVATGLAFGSQAVAGPITSSGDSSTWTDWGAGRDLSWINQTTTDSTETSASLADGSAYLAGQLVSHPVATAPVTPRVFKPSAQTVTPPLLPDFTPAVFPSLSPKTPPPPVYWLPPVYKLADWRPPQAITHSQPAPVPVQQPAPAPVPVHVQPHPVVTPTLPAPAPVTFTTPAVRQVYTLPVGVHLAPWSPSPGTPGLAGDTTSTTPAADPSVPPPPQNITGFTSAPGTTVPPVNAFINMGNGPFADAGILAKFTPSAWFNNPTVQGFFGGSPTPQQQADFANTVLARVQETFQQSGINVTLTSDPTVPASHTLSLVASTEAKTLHDAIGMTNVGGNGLSFIDQQASAAQSLSQLEWIAAHNIAHELMLAFGVGENYDQSGHFIDARSAFWTMMVDPSATFSPDAIAAINLALVQASADSGQPSPQLIDPHPVPEPSALAVWAAVSLAVATGARKRSPRS